MALRDAVIRAGVIPSDYAERSLKKAYSEVLSRELAIEVAEGLRGCGFVTVRPMREMIKTGKRRGEFETKQEKEFQGGLGPKRVDVSYSDDRHGLMLAVSIKTLNFASFPKLPKSEPPTFDCTKPNFSKNIKNRFGDLTTEAITLHLRFPFAVVGCLYVMPERSRTEKGALMRISTFDRALQLYGTVSGRRMYGDPAEKFEDVTLLLHRPLTDSTSPADVWVQLYRAGSEVIEITEQQYFSQLVELYNLRNPHAMIGELDETEAGYADSPSEDPE